MFTQTIGMNMKLITVFLLPLSAFQQLFEKDYINVQRHLEHVLYEETFL